MVQITVEVYVWCVMVSFAAVGLRRGWRRARRLYVLLPGMDLEIARFVADWRRFLGGQKRSIKGRVAKLVLFFGLLDLVVGR